MDTRLNQSGQIQKNTQSHKRLTSNREDKFTYVDALKFPEITFDWKNGKSFHNPLDYTSQYHTFFNPEISSFFPCFRHATRKRILTYRRVTVTAQVNIITSDPRRKKKWRHNSQHVTTSAQQTRISDLCAVTSQPHHTTSQDFFSLWIRV